MNNWGKNVEQKKRPFRQNLGGRGFKTKEALQASLSPSDRKCIALWENYRFTRH